MSCKYEIKGLMAVTMSQAEYDARKKFREEYFAQRHNDNDLPTLRPTMKPTTVYITKGRHPSQKYTVLIQPHKGEAYKLRQRYARVYTAKRGALRNLDAVTTVNKHPFNRAGKPSLIYYQTPKGSLIKFVLK